MLGGEPSGTYPAQGEVGGRAEDAIMRILHVIADLAPRCGGPPRACLGMARALASRGHEVTIYTTNQDGPGVLDVPLDTPVIDQGVRIRYFPVQTPRFWATSWPMRRTLYTELPGFDLVHIHSLYLFHDWAAAAACRHWDIPYVIRPHGTLDPYLTRRHRFRKLLIDWAFQSDAMRRAAAVHFTAEEERRLAQPYVHGRPAIVVPIGVSLDEFRPIPPRGDFRGRFPRLQHRQLLLFFGRINFKKGLELLIDAFSRLRSRRNGLHLVLAGPDNEGYGKRVRQLIAARGLTDEVTFTGMLEGRERLALLRDADLFVLPSYTENFGVSIIEAMACGLPVAISDRVNIHREIAAAGAGLVVPCEADPIAAACERVLGDPNLAHRMGKAGQALVEAHYQWPSIGKQLEAAYESLLARPRSRNGQGCQ
jgi:glycosyltransferase involved in cell wall biosynthesis